MKWSCSSAKALVYGTVEDQTLLNTKVEKVKAQHKDLGEAVGEKFGKVSRISAKEETHEVRTEVA
ncbi:hypothetical protein HO173_010714 [Letharia columbiana]|uniref:Uncharacterized protein n=1 Tax=Letharia columbiana TaxID=112416 RepID=A0A8H6L0I3_9LECA|nr:uncharacterized protein HO173_010714 [Letharia columbiana]KAF6231014.1 hypothetical protein HO173_010714 [Letharia columbiana]